MIRMMHFDTFASTFTCDQVAINTNTKYHQESMVTALRHASLQTNRKK
jgi:hypothetical protein